MTASDANPTNQGAAARKRRVGWIAGTRGELLLLGPVFRTLCRRDRADRYGRVGWLLCTGEQGMAAYQALDFLGLAADETSPLCHPADDPAIRLTGMLRRTETTMHRRKLTHVIVTGFGPTAAAAAIR